MSKINLLDHGFIRLVDSMGGDLSIVRSARVSHNAEWRSGEDAGKDEKLIGYLMNNRHTTPFEAVHFTFEIKCPIFVVRQWHRHRTWSYNEVSARYTELPEEFYIPEAHVIGAQSSSNKQARVFVPKEELSPDDEWDANLIRQTMQEQNESAFRAYKDFLALGVPRELARSVLPVGTYTHFFGSVNLHNLFHFLRLRLHSHAQYEIRVYAEAILELIEPIAPVAVAAFKETL